MSLVLQRDDVSLHEVSLHKVFYSREMELNAGGDTFNRA